MIRKLSLIAVFVLLTVWVVPANADGPNFGSAIYADGQAWGTKGLASLPAVNASNEQSYDKLFAFTNGADGQLPVAEAGPGNPAYNGGRWYTHTVEWTAAGIAAHNPLPVLKSYADIQFHAMLGHLNITPGTFDGGPRPFFECPLLPVKQ